MITRPMLAETWEEKVALKFPVLASPKLDGIRCVIVNGRALSRKFKDIPNDFTRQYLEKLAINGLDGELMIKGKTFNEIQSAIMKKSGEPDFSYHVFDRVTNSLKDPFLDRYVNLVADQACGLLAPRIQVVQHHRINSEEELLAYEVKCLAEGYEGVMIRSFSGPYKCGRSTLKEGYLLKLKRFEDSEAEILSFFELEHNENEQEENELGLSKRSSRKDGMVKAGTLGGFKLRDRKTGVEFDIGTGEGLTQELRQEIWDNQDKYKELLVKYRFQPSGVKEKPRFPIWIGFRHPDDMGE